MQITVSCERSVEIEAVRFLTQYLGEKQVPCVDACD